MAFRDLRPSASVCRALSIQYVGPSSVLLILRQVLVGGHQADPRRLLSFMCLSLVCAPGFLPSPSAPMMHQVQHWLKDPQIGFQSGGGFQAATAICAVQCWRNCHSSRKISMIPSNLLRGRSAPREQLQVEAQLRNCPHAHLGPSPLQFKPQASRSRFSVSANASGASGVVCTNRTL